MEIRKADGTREAGKPTSAAQQGEVCFRSPVAGHGATRSLVGELGEGGFGNGEIPNLPSDLVGSDGQDADAFQHLDSFLQHLWQWEPSARTRHCGGWCELPQRGEDLRSRLSGFWQQWPRIGSGDGEKTWPGTSKGDTRSFLEVCEASVMEEHGDKGGRFGGVLPWSGTWGRANPSI